MSMSQTRTSVHTVRFSDVSQTQNHRKKIGEVGHVTPLTLPILRLPSRFRQDFFFCPESLLSSSCTDRTGSDEAVGSLTQSQVHNDEDTIRSQLPFLSLVTAPTNHAVKCVYVCVYVCVRARARAVHTCDAFIRQINEEENVGGKNLMHLTQVVYTY